MSVTQGLRDEHAGLSRERARLMKRVDEIDAKLGDLTGGLKALGVDLAQEATDAADAEAKRVEDLRIKAEGEKPKPAHRKPTAEDVTDDDLEA